jgi:hypothetical protein
MNGQKSVDDSDDDDDPNDHDDKQVSSLLTSSTIDQNIEINPVVSCLLSLARVSPPFPPHRIAMVWPFSSSSSSSSSSQPSKPIAADGGYIAPDRSARQRCYDSRDRLFACLDRNDILDAVKEDDRSHKVCGGENDGYERDCARAWVGQWRFWTCLSCTLYLLLTDDDAIDGDSDQVFQGEESDGV